MAAACAGAPGSGTFKGPSCPPPSGAERIGAGVGRMSNLVLERGEGSWVYTDDGERYLDFSTGIGVVSLGHCHPKVMAAVHRQVDKIWHAQVGIGHHPQMLELTGKLQKIMPAGSNLDTFIFVTSGAEAVESAVKLARHATGKPNIIVFQGGYHGRTLLTMSMTTNKTIYRAGYGPHAPGIFVAPHPYYCDRPGKLADPTQWTVEQLELLLLTQTTKEETAALIIEPVLGEGGYVPPPEGLLKALRDFCNRRGLLFIVDEVQTGFGRTGRMFAVERYGVSPDILVFAKGVASGLPLAGIAASRALMDAQPAGCQGGTYAGNAVACAAANATIEVMSEEGFFQNVEERGMQLTQGLQVLQQANPELIREVRGPGLMIGVEFNDQKVEKGFASKVSKACLSRGMIVLSTGVFETLRLIPPLTVSSSECQHALAVLEAAIKEAASGALNSRL
ncbi:unnamed protein product [Polarella glacialis]|uniref:Acetylornithine transaminase n=1 Tax=Polarella glacialis TaxID=89957 RepID=A0A813E4A8_POLGL|nr:unnamed protein product [Polarella glacialis]CAE8595070.1 unnamed protein product [Polarella glacialis]CAE8693097.1 unnamed protein product [Polarella glacialis]